VGPVFIALDAKDGENIEALSVLVGAFLTGLDQISQAAKPVCEFCFVRSVIEPTHTATSFLLWCFPQRADRLTPPRWRFGHLHKVSPTVPLLGHRADLQIESILIAISVSDAFSLPTSKTLLMLTKDDSKTMAELLTAN